MNAREPLPKTAPPAFVIKMAMVLRSLPVPAEIAAFDRSWRAPTHASACSRVAPRSSAYALAACSTRGRWSRVRWLLLLALVWCSGCVTVGASVGSGLASYYGANLHGRPTANGERFDKDAFTAAHRTLPIGSCVLVTSVATGRTVKVRINDRGPFVKNRVIDLSEAAARALGLIDAGVSEVKLNRCGP